MPQKEKVGSEVIAYCATCKMDLAAVIVSMGDVKIARVQCKTCKKERAYKAAKGVTDPTKVVKKKASKKLSKEENAAKQAVAVEAEWQTLLNQAVHKKARRVRYTPKESLIVGDVIEHPSFGDGVVMKLMHPNKAEVIFKTDLKVMMHSLSR